MTTKVHLLIFLLTEQSFPATIRELFPDTNGIVLPPLRTFKYKTDQQLINLRKMVNDETTEFDILSILVARGHVIIGWKKRRTIERLYDLSGRTNIVFDTDANKFVSLRSEELWRLGVGRDLAIVSANDEAVLINRASLELNQQVDHEVSHSATHKPIHQENDRLNSQANNQEYYQASQQANLQAVHQANPQSYHQENHEVNHDVNHQANHQAHPQLNIEANTKAYQKYEEYLRRHGYNNSI